LIGKRAMLRGNEVFARIPQELYLAAALAVAPFLLGPVGASPSMLSRIVIWGIFGLGFQLLFGVAGLLSFGQTIFYGVGGFMTAYLLLNGHVANLYVALAIGTISAVAIGFMVGALSVRRSGIYFAMVTLAFSEFVYFLEFSPLRQWTGGEDGLAGVPQPPFFANPLAMYASLAAVYVVGYALARHVRNSSFGLILRAIKRNNHRTEAVGHNVWMYRVGVFCIASAYAGFAGGLLGMFQTYMPPDAFNAQTSVELVVQTMIGGVGLLVGPLVGAFIWTYLRTTLQIIPGIGALWLVLLALVFVFCILFLPQGIAGAIKDAFTRKRRTAGATTDMPLANDAVEVAEPLARVSLECAAPVAGRIGRKSSEPILRVRNITKRFGGLIAVNGVSFDVAAGGIVALIGPNGAGKTTLFSMLADAVRPTSGEVLFKQHNISGIGATRACQLGVSKSYQITQLFRDMSVYDNVSIPVLARRYGSASLRTLLERPGADAVRVRVEKTLAEIGLQEVRDWSIDELPYGNRRRLEIGLALASDPELLLLDEPLAGLSPSERVDIKVLIAQIANHTNVLIVEHDMDAVYELAERVIVLHRGEILFDGSPEDMRGNEAVRSAYLGRRVLLRADQKKSRVGAS
jgi:branched-chain amino acid transport system ATP-binding protein/branched-chain amino acid transport system permease protein